MVCHKDQMWPLIKDLSEEVEMPVKFIYDTKLGQLEYRTKIQNNIVVEMRRMQQNGI